MTLDPGIIVFRGQWMLIGYNDGAGMYRSCIARSFSSHSERTRGTGYDGEGGGGGGG